ncbi:MAG: hypothetical protein EPN97_10925 [Alphaproteobacteria bacterium]|nr:MAG: hypothetical protein EPN97_10925 [Alphaproteobacteria bacterium]
MLVLCYAYCIPLLKFLYFMMGPFFIVFGMFALKRGMRLRSQSLRQTAFFLMFGSALKMCLFDVYMLAEGVKDKVCIAGKFPALDCSVASISPHETLVLSFFGIVLLCVSCMVLFHYYRVYLPDRKFKDYTPDEVHLKFWVNVTLWSVIVMGLWVAAPWFGALLGAALPRIFLAVKWKTLALFNLGMILFDFWKMESVTWEQKADANKADRARRRHLQQTWTSKDTLWMTIFLYLLLCGLSYVGNDVLGPKNANEQTQHRMGVKDLIPDVDISNPALKGN